MLIIAASTVRLATKRLAVTSFGCLGTGLLGLGFSLKRRMVRLIPSALLGFTAPHVWARFELAKTERLESEQSTLHFFGLWSGPAE